MAPFHYATNQSPQRSLVSKALDVLIMNKDDNQKWDLETAARVQERAQFYSLTLAFTLLALSIQTIDISDDKIVAILESIAVLALLVSGLTGLWRALEIPAIYKIQIHLHSLNANIEEGKEIKAQGAPLIYSPLLEKSFKVDEYIEDHKNGVKHFVSEKKKIESKLAVYMRLHKYCLLIGIVFIMFSRVFVPAVKALCV